MARLALHLREGADLHRAGELERRLGCQLVDARDDADEAGRRDRPMGTGRADGDGGFRIRDSTEGVEATEGIRLVLDADGLALAENGMEIRGDFTRMLPRLRNGVLQRELLVRAARVKSAAGSLRAVDATAGLGEDALLLAAAGFEVLLCERNPVIASLLEDALRRAGAHPELADAVSRMSLHIGESQDALASLEYRPDVVFLDPMFPEKRHGAASRKKLQMLQKLEQPCQDEAGLFEAACGTHPRKLVVKRPVRGPYLAGCKPGYSLAGKTVRYDVYPG